MDTNALLRVCHVCMNTSKEEFTIRQLTMFLTIARHPGMSVSDLAEHTDLPYPAVAKNVRLMGRYLDSKVTLSHTMLTTAPRIKERGHGIIISRLDPWDNRRREIVLSPLGELLYQELLEVSHVIPKSQEGALVHEVLGKGSVDQP